MDMFNTDRGLMDPTNGLLMDEINKTEGPQLKENRDQQYYEGNDVFANFQLPNIENEKRFIQQVQNTNNETKQLDSTLFSHDRIDNDIVNRMIIEDINNPASNIMGEDADDGIRNAKNSQVEAGNFANQIANANTNNVKMQTEEINFKNTSSAVMEALQKLDRGSHVLRLPKFPKPLEAKAQKEAAAQRRNMAVSYFLGKFMAPGKPYSIKPFGKDSSSSLLPNLEVEMDRSELLSSLQDLREAGLVHDNAGSLKNSCGHRWFVGPKSEVE